MASRRKGASGAQRRRDKLGRKTNSAGTRQIRSLFGIVVEGETEKRYFGMEYFHEPSVKVMVNPGKPNDPPALARAADALIEELKRGGELRSGDQIWVVLDADDWADAQLEEVFRWSQERREKGDRGVGLCIPQFEYWLLLHFEDGRGVGTKAEVLHRLERYLPGYRKNVPLFFTEEDIKAAVGRARARVPEEFGTLADLDAAIGRGTASTTVHFLVERMVQSLTDARALPQ